MLQHSAIVIFDLPTRISVRKDLRLPVRIKEERFSLEIGHRIADVFDRLPGPQRFQYLRSRKIEVLFLYGPFGGCLLFAPSEHVFEGHIVSVAPVCEKSQHQGGIKKAACAAALQIFNLTTSFFPASETTKRATFLFCAPSISRMRPDRFSATSSGGRGL